MYEGDCFTSYQQNQLAALQRLFPDAYGNTRISHLSVVKLGLYFLSLIIVAGLGGAAANAVWHHNLTTVLSIVTTPVQTALAVLLVAVTALVVLLVIAVISMVVKFIFLPILEAKESILTIEGLNKIALDPDLDCSFKTKIFTAAAENGPLKISSLGGEILSATMDDCFKNVALELKMGIVPLSKAVTHTDS